MNRLMLLAPNWLGDAVLALPAIADVRRAAPRAEITVVARASIAPLFSMVSDVDRVVVADARLPVHKLGRALAQSGCDTALLFPNSMRAALIVVFAGVRERWGYRAGLRGALLTRAIDRPSGLHQGEYYQQLVHALGFPNGPIEPHIAVPPAVRQTGAEVLREAGWDGAVPIVALAPGAAYGGAKRWPPESFADLAAALAARRVQSVMIGTAADGGTAGEVSRALHSSRPHDRGAAERPALLTIVGRTDLPTLAGVLANCRALITNDSGAMHLAAAVGTIVTAVFGPTDERATRPLGDAHRVMTFPVWCRPCMLRECPLDHRCMVGVDAAAVAAVASRSITA